MNANPPRNKPLALEPIDTPTAGGDAAGAGLQRALGITTEDEFLAQAAKEYQEGHIDQALWSGTSAQSGGDEALAIAAYLRARATALRLKKRDERAEKRASRAESVDGANTSQGALQPPQEALSTKGAGASPSKVQRKIRYAAAAVGLAAAAAVVWLVTSPRDTPSVPGPIAVAAAVAGNPATPAPSPASEQAVVQVATGPADRGGPDPTLEAKVHELKKAGNWNVLVLYASEWTRKEPRNAAAWTQLSIGYDKLRQPGDALEAARKAVELAPEDSLHWRNLGHVHRVLERLPEARIAFDRALAVSPEDGEALCGAASIAKSQGRVKDADGIALRLTSTGGSCSDASDSVDFAVVAGGATPRKSVSSGGR